jgi:hypothetical protein
VHLCDIIGRSQSQQPNNDLQRAASCSRHPTRVIRAASYCAASMVPDPIRRWLKANIHPTEVWFFFGAMVRFAAFTAWGNLIVRLIRGEKAKEDWRTLSSAAALITFSTLTSAAEAREFASLRQAAVEMRGLVDDATAQAELRDQRATERDRQAAKQQADMLLLNKRMVMLAAVTLAVALVALAVAIAR